VGLKIRHDDIALLPRTREVYFVGKNGDRIETGIEQHGIDDGQGAEMRAAMAHGADRVGLMTWCVHNSSTNIDSI
jgi:hypothetical protein